MVGDGAALSQGFGAVGFGLPPDVLAQLHGRALRILSRIGLEVRNASAGRLLKEAGAIPAGNDRFLFPEELVTERLQALQENWPAPTNQVVHGQLRLSIGDMCQYYHNPHSDTVEPMTTANLIEATKFVECARSSGLDGNVPGIPADVPPQLQALVAYRVGTEFSACGGSVHTLYPPEALPFLFAMAEAMGQPMETCAMFTVSPLRLVGHEFDQAVAHASHWKQFFVHSLPAVGATAPLDWGTAWALSIAEALGGAVALHIIGCGKPVMFRAGLYPFDLRSMAVVGGGPEFPWICWMEAQVNRFYNPAALYSMMLGSQAKKPGAQAGLEKGLAGAFGVATGCGALHYAGVLSYDDIFSPSQTVLDCELRDALDHLRRMRLDLSLADWLEAISGGLRRGFVDTELTLTKYREAYWCPRVLDRTTWHELQVHNAKGAEGMAREQALAWLSSYKYQPPAGAIEQVRRIFVEAWKALGGDACALDIRSLCNEG
jgi:trimethylamine:corrinoid methyltransferase-like protein